MSIVHAVGKLTCAVALGVSILGASSAAQAQEEVNVRFSWKLKGEYAAMYVAQEKGFYTREGLTVRLGEGAGAPAALGALLQGQEDAVLLPAIFALTAISKGMPVKLISMYHPVTPIALISWPENPVNVPKDLEGKTIGTAIGETGTTYLESFCKNNGTDCSKVKKVQVDAQSRVPLFVQHKVDVVSVYQTNDLPVLEEKQGAKFVVLEMNKNGLSVPGMALVSSDAIIAKKPETLRKLLKAVGDGVVAMKKDPADAATMLVKSWPGHPSITSVTSQVKATAEAIPAAAGRPVGWIDEKVIADALQLLKSTGEVDAPKAPNAYYTNSLLGAK
jgi:NitT/TauT family transport system substrate-binding protein